MKPRVAATPFCGLDAPFACAIITSTDDFLGDDTRCRGEVDAHFVALLHNP